MADFLRRTWAEISLDALLRNVEAIRSLLSPKTKLMAVVKADAYGHGDALTAKTLWEAGVRFFGVSNLEEAISIRRTTPEGDILVFGFTPPGMVKTLAEHNVMQTVYSLPFAKALSKEAVACGVLLPCHLKFDTGMGRLGLLGHDKEACLQEAREILALPGLSFQGVFTHFASADERTPDGESYTRAQFSDFMDLTNTLLDEGYHLGLRHCCNSPATLYYPEMHLDMVRPGLLLYGLFPSGEERGAIPLHPVMTLKSTVAMVKTLPEGAAVSYGRMYVAPKPISVATIPVGYADGYERTLSGKAHMLLHGKKVPVIGRICMDQLMLDVSGVDGQPGDEVILFGKSPNGEEISASEVARWAGTISYEIVCILGKRVPRVYQKGGKQIAVTRYKYIRY